MDVKYDSISRNTVVPMIYLLYYLFICSFASSFLGGAFIYSLSVTYLVSVKLSNMSGGCMSYPLVLQNSNVNVVWLAVMDVNP